MLSTWLCWTKKKQCESARADASASRAQRRREGVAGEQGSATARVAAARGRRPNQQDEDLVQTDGAAGIAQHSRRCTGDGDVDATAKRTHGRRCCGLMGCCLEKMRVVPGDGVDDEPMGRATVWGRPMHSRWRAGAADGLVDADIEVVRARSSGGGRLNPNQ